MFNWLFGKKEEVSPAKVETKIANGDLANANNLIELFPDLLAAFHNNPSELMKLVSLPKVSVVLKDNLWHENIGCVYLSSGGQIITITKRLQYDNKPIKLCVSKKKINPPVTRIAENIHNNFKKWTWCFDENTNQILYAERGTIHFDNKHKKLTVNSETIELYEVECSLIADILLAKVRTQAKEEENQKRAAMDEVVAELFKGE